MKLNWTKKEFEAYLLLFAAHANHVEDKKENEFINTLVDKKTLHKIHTEVVVDSEEENLSKIQEYISNSKFTNSEKENLLRNIKKVLFADGSVDILEKKAYTILQKMLS
ncbi:hypothetical protein [uncultured Polaribacter sp.]|uniref:hypothetical protein n=1 Tax=uncultured Polaribacter sp. TaxID=174711 RepID=UPI00261C705B|nr:hypothetical protein [uncultured Polaribacter sp.]